MKRTKKRHKNVRAWGGMPYLSVKRMKKKNQDKHIRSVLILEQHRRAMPLFLSSYYSFTRCR